MQAFFFILKFFLLEPEPHEIETAIQYFFFVRIKKEETKQQTNKERWVEIIVEFDKEKLLRTQKLHENLAIIRRSFCFRIRS
jgi:hypothetical protein